MASMKSTQLAIASTASVVFIVYRVVIWRARSRAKKTAKRVADLIQTGRPLIDVHDEHLRKRIVKRAIRRASNWMTFSSTKNAQPMLGQVGGASIHKKPVLTLSPDYVLKPVLTDHRGIREISFYEALEAVAKAPSSQTYSTFLKRGTTPRSGLLSQMGEVVDTLALACAMLVHDEVVMASESAMRKAWRRVKREAEHLHNLSKHTPRYFGIVGLDTPSTEFPFGVSDETHILFRDLTANFSRPCVMDLKMGTVTYEDDAPQEKKKKESSKYAQQEEFGFRIVGMRVFDPNNKGEGELDESGYRFYGKHYGRGLESRDQVKQALKTYFGAQSDTCPPEIMNGRMESKIVREVRTKSISSIIQQLRMIRKWFEDNSSMLFCASSLLLVYEGNASCSAPDVTTLKMIDFGRVRRNSPKGDPGYLHGLNTLKDLLCEIIDDEKARLGESSRSINGSSR